MTLESSKNLLFVIVQNGGKTQNVYTNTTKQSHYTKGKLLPYM